jgi:fructoselysine 6-kinase
VPVRIVDTLGAGDTFIARTLVGLLRQESPDDLLAAAAVAAARTCGQVGGIGHPAAIDIDESQALSLDEIYALPGMVWT